MPKPAPRLPQAGSATENEAPAASLAPAPDNGVPFAEQSTQPTPAAPRPVVERRGKQLGMRIPEAIYDRLEQCSSQTGFTKSSLVAHALDDKLKSLGY